MIEGFECTWGEKRNINVGNYESREVFASISKRIIDRHNHIVTVEHAEKASAETIEEAHEKLKELKFNVQKVLDREERRVRKLALPWVEHENGMKKIKAIDMEKYKTDKA